MENNNYAIETNDLSIHYGKFTAVKDVSMKVERKKITAIIGPSGCGKSTLLRALSRLLSPSGGAVMLDGQDLHRLNPKDVARRLAILPQGPVAPEGLTVEQLVWFGRHPHQGFLGGRSEADRAQVAWAMSQTGMTAFAGRPLEALSGGQRQRAWIAMSLAQSTPVLLLDEPTTYLDLSHQLEVLELVQRLNREQGKTVVMVLHDLNQAVRYSDELVAVQGGQVYAQGDPATLMTPELLRDVFGLKAHVLQDPDTGRPHIIPYAVARVLSPQGGSQ